MIFLFKNIVQSYLPGLLTGLLFFFPYVSLCMEEYEWRPLVQPRLISSQSDLLSFFEDKEQSLKKRLDTAFNFLQTEEGTSEQRRDICGIFFPFALGVEGIFKEGEHLTAADIIVDHGNAQQRKMVCETLFSILGNETIPVKERIYAAQILSAGGTLVQRKQACEALVSYAQDDRMSPEERLQAGEALYEHGTGTQKNIVFFIMREILAHKKETIPLESVMYAAEGIASHGLIQEEEQFGTEILTEGLERDSSLLSIDFSEVGYDGAVIFYGNSLQKERVRRVLTSVFTDEKRKLPERLRAASVLISHSAEITAEETGTLIEEINRLFEAPDFLSMDRRSLIKIFHALLFWDEISDGIKERARTFLLKTSQDRSLSTEDRMNAAGALYTSNACYGKENEEVKKTVISLVQEFSTLPLDSFCSFYIPHDIFPETEDEKNELGKKLLSILENKDLSISPVVYVKFLSLFSSPGALPDQQMRVSFLLQSFLEERNEALFLERSRVVAARALSQGGDASQKTYGLSILTSIFEDENVLIELRCEALEAFMSFGSLDQKERGGTALLSFLENHDFPRGQRISIARTIKELGTEEQIRRMKIILSSFLQSREIDSRLSGYIQEIIG